MKFVFLKLIWGFQRRFFNWFFHLLLNFGILIQVFVDITIGGSVRAHSSISGCFDLNVDRDAVVLTNSCERQPLKNVLLLLALITFIGLVPFFGVLHPVRWYQPLNWFLFLTQNLWNFVYDRPKSGWFLLSFELILLMNRHFLLFAQLPHDLVLYKLVIWPFLGSWRQWLVLKVENLIRFDTPFFISRLTIQSLFKSRIRLKSTILHFFICNFFLHLGDFFLFVFLKLLHTVVKVSVRT